ncbi:MAG: hypothetical protein V3V20_11765, partial [Algisphaera sp.]
MTCPPPATFTTTPTSFIAWPCAWLWHITLALSMAALPVTGCHGPVVVTFPSHPAQPTTVYLAHYDFYHTSLVIPNDAGATEYTYGDWDLFALNDRDTWSKFKGILLLTQGALGRRDIAYKGQADTDLLNILAHEGCWKLSRYTVNHKKLTLLQNQLDIDFNAKTHTAIYRPQSDMTFVKYPRLYSLAHNCNHALKAWIQDLGGTVTGWVALADYQTPHATHTFAPDR